MTQAYLRARYYDSSIGRFITEDPAKDGLNWYAFCSNNPVTFVDPSGLYITVAEKDSETFKNAVSVVFGESVKFMYDEENPDRIIGFSYDGKVGSKTTADLFNFMANDAEAEYSIGFYNVSDGSKGTSDGNKAKNSYWLNVNQSNADIYEQIARIAHEATHLYTLKQGYNDAVEKDIYWRQDINERQKYTSDIVKGYQEMTAMLVENCVRKELNASYGKNGAQVVAPRLLSDGYGSMLDSTAKMKDAVSGYGFGFWPWMPCSYEGTSEQRASDFYGMYQFAFENTTLNMTLGIIPDIWRNAN